MKNKNQKEILCVDRGELGLLKIFDDGKSTLDGKEISFELDNDYYENAKARLENSLNR